MTPCSRCAREHRGPRDLPALIRAIDDALAIVARQTGDVQRAKAGELHLRMLRAELRGLCADCSWETVTEEMRTARAAAPATAASQSGGRVIDLGVRIKPRPPFYGDAPVVPPTPTPTTTK